VVNSPRDTIYRRAYCNIRNAINSRDGMNNTTLARQDSSNIRSLSRNVCNERECHMHMDGQKRKGTPA
jgi:hypothetical protein